VEYVFYICIVNLLQRERVTEQTNTMYKRQTLITERQYLESVRIVNEYLLQQTDKSKVKRIHIDKVDITTRLYNLLKRHSVEYLNDVGKMELSDFMKWRDFGKKTLQELEDVLDLYRIPRSW
jgi:DNA-directed RNA polymerase subunit alpha